METKQKAVDPEPSYNHEVPYQNNSPMNARKTSPLVLLLVVLSVQVLALLVYGENLKVDGSLSFGSTVEVLLPATISQRDAIDTSTTIEGPALTTAPLSQRDAIDTSTTIEGPVLTTAPLSTNSTGYHRIPVYNVVSPRDRGMFDQSRYLRDTKDANGEGVVWIANWISFDKPRCQSLMMQVLDSQERRQQRNNTSFTPQNASFARSIHQLRPWQIYLTDSSDRTSTVDLGMCLKRLELVFGIGNVFFARRSLVKGRDFACMHVRNTTCPIETTKFNQLNGSLWDYSEHMIAQHIYGGTIAKWDFAVNTGIEKALENHFIALWSNHTNIMSSKITLESFRFEDGTRPHQVAHFWEVEPDEEFGHLRNQVTLAVRRVLKAHPSWTGTAGLISTRGRIGRRTVNLKYIEALATHKIIVVCQRDEWEDHLRLWEGLISGALVLSDPMTHMPVGLEENVHLAIYQSIPDLERQIEYYLSPEGTPSRLEMAKAGYQAALKHHLGWHRYERMIVGEWPKDRFHAVIPALPEDPNSYKEL